MTIFEINIFWFTLAPSYYWLMYAIWFMSWYYIISKRKFIESAKLDDLFLYIVFWVILWWRFWYILFYNLSGYLSKPLDIFKVWEWWMSFHWWVIGVIIAMYIFSKKYKIDFFKLADQITLVLPIWLWLGRIWNYLNKELLWYGWYDWFLAVYKNWIWYFPSTLVEFFLEWIVLFLILNVLYYKKKLSKWVIASLFLIFYWLFRIFVEIFFRMPDVQIWYIYWYFTMWEILSMPMIIIWWFLFFKLNNKNAN
jgi:phosphatidylglycerol:prolipoprotein diacylglycerol transferase